MPPASHLSLFTSRLSPPTTCRWIVGSGSHAGIYPQEPKFRTKIVRSLAGLPGLEVYNRHDIPDSLHYRHSRNSPPILVLAKPQTIILSNPADVQRPSQGHCQERWRGGKARPRLPADMDSSRLMEQIRMGLAGYSPEQQDMRGIFMAQGPGQRLLYYYLLRAASPPSCHYIFPAICFCLSINKIVFNIIFPSEK